MATKRALLQTRTLLRHRQEFLTSSKELLMLQTRHYSSPQQSKSLVGGEVQTEQLEELLRTPTWSVESLLPPKAKAPNAPIISPRQLHHLLRLSALPLPGSPQEEKKMLDTLAAQLHFVGEIQSVDTTGVEPLRAIRDETAAAEKEQTITLDTMKNALAQEQVIGKHYKRIQRKTAPADAKAVEDWDVLGSAERKSGQFFVVESERPQE